MILAAVLALAASGAPAHPVHHVRAKTARQGAGDVCVSVATLWIGSTADAQAIHTTPVPASFRIRFQPGAPCDSLIKQTLIDWHLDFGDEASTTAALDFLERGMAPLAGDPATLPTTLAAELNHAVASAAWQEAVRRSSAQPQQWSGRPRLAREIVALRARMAQVDFAQLLGSQFLVAAEQWRSPALLARADHYLQAVEKAYALYAEHAISRNAEPSSFLALSPADALEITDLHVRRVLLGATLRRDPAGLDVAAAALAAEDDPVVQAIGQSHYSGIASFCLKPPASAAAAAAAIRAACEDEDALERHAIHYWRNAALLTFARVALGQCVSRSEPAVETATLLLRAAWERDPSEPAWPSYHGRELFRLHLAAAELGEEERSVDCFLPPDAREEAIAAARLAAPPEGPARFLLAARAHLALPPTDSVFDQRWRAYFATTIKHLDAIASGRTDD